MQLTAQRFTVKHLLKPIARAQFIEEALGNKFEGLQALSPPLQPPPMSLGRFERAERCGRALQPLRRGNGARSDPRRVLSGLGGAGGEHSTPPLCCSPTRQRQPGPELVSVS